MSTTHRPIAVLVILLAAFALVGCSDSASPPPPPGIQPEIVNVTDSFEYQIQSIDLYSGTAQYSWNNTGTIAAVDHSSVISGGSGLLVVRDADGTTVYSGLLSNSGSLASAAGAVGVWTVTLTYSQFSGTVNFRVQKG